MYVEHLKESTTKNPPTVLKGSFSPASVILCYAQFALNYFNDTHCIYFPFGVTVIKHQGINLDMERNNLLFS